MQYSENILKKTKSESYVSPKVKCVSIEGKGKGLIAKEKISKGEIVSISGGLIFKEEDHQKELVEKGIGDYCYYIEEGFLICPINPEDPSDDWRMNHCCEPNCGVRGQIVFVALRDIEINEELTFDYAMTETDPNYSVPLSCDKSSCRKTFSGNDWKNPDIQKKYKGHMSLYIERKIQNNET
ncbi:MAG TPA: SET domain-containing protein [Leptospiraceae bacterium]|nr:SET domain-containing protein [Leptospiraceae bacterium]HMW06673.1 SET domain-containing protein [Leptospiraceae bacterium]HMX34117.1 SET domain-containing protein [Leptospiraceae bacterium]HMY33724.1 SET domain-containing protein [Leptospiraceae bacterium]HMZ64931.1 SET domain-containing protein [Leptospiraceae bacterium]